MNEYSIFKVQILNISSNIVFFINSVYYASKSISFLFFILFLVFLFPIFLSFIASTSFIIYTIWRYIYI